MASRKVKNRSSNIIYISNKQLRDAQNKRMQNIISKTVNVGGGSKNAGVNAFEL